jgi:4-hydroxyphenylacetate 3-monooxygenase
MRTGPEYLNALADGRSVFVDGERVESVLTHPGFAGIARTVAELYETSSTDPTMAFSPEETGSPANAVYMIPRSREDLAHRRAAIERWARVTLGYVGRSPDHVGGFLAGMASAGHVFDQDGRGFGGNVRAFYRRVLDEDLFVSYVIIPPQTARAADTDEVQVGVVSEDESGIVVRGGQILGTGSAVSDYLFVSCIRPLGPTEDRLALSFVVPLDTPGLRLHCRRPYASAQPSEFDYPLSTRFDETDAIAVFDDVFVPWSSVFVHRDVTAARDQFFATPAHVLGNSQAQIRLVTKLKFMIGLAHRMADANEVTKIPSVQERLGELASLAAVCEGMVLAAEASSAQNADGVEVPNRRFVYGAMGLQSELYPRVLSIMRELAGAGMLQVPASHRDLASPETRDDILRFASSPTVAGEDRIKLFKLAWDAVGSEFAGRHHQYEMFYAGAPFLARASAYRNYGYDEALALVDTFLASYSAPVPDDSGLAATVFPDAPGGR